MRTLSNKEIIDFTTGAFYFQDNGSGLFPQRFAKPEYEYWSDFNNEPCNDMFLTRVLCPAGVVVSFKTDADVFSFKCSVGERAARDFAIIDVWVNDTFMYAFEKTDMTIEGECALAGKGIKEVRMYLPHSRPCAIDSIKIPFGASIASLKRSKTLLAHGDSITQGMTACNPSLTYASVLARELDMDIINQGVGGWKFIVASLVSAIPVKPAAITLALGTNDYSNSYPLENIGSYINRLRIFYPTTPIFAIVPIYRLNQENNINANGHTVGVYRNALKEACQQTNNCHFIAHEGLVPACSSLFADEIHPNNSGSMIYGTQAAKAIRATGVI